MVLYFCITVPSIASKNYTNMYFFLALSIITAFIVQIMMICLGFTDPGMVPKILPSY
jgi:hypothetical protein